MRAASENSLRAAETVLRNSLQTAAVDPMEVAENLFGISDLLRRTPRVRMALTDPGRSAEDKVAFVSQLLAEAVTAQAESVLAELARGHWSHPDDVAVACEELGNEAVFLAAQKVEKLEEVESQLFAVNEFLGEQRQLRIALTDLGVGSAHDRAHFAARLFNEALNPYASRLLRRTVRLSKHGRLTSRLRELIASAAHRRNQMVATVTTASALSEQQLQRLRTILEKRYAQGISINTVIDPSVLGGMNIEVGQDAINATVSSQLAKVKRELANT
ncbi:MAG: F0F1 ATP synthase subunit delta [Actinomycetaceae bacterium]|nr:F0F1 ATP synthase subunit delta [Actinomycetaceae bacterium]